MSTLVVSLLAALTLVSLVVGRLASRRSPGFVADHVGLFAFGVLFYWAVPVAVGLFLPATSDTLPTLWLDQFRKVDALVLAQFIALSMVFLLAWYAGALVRRRTIAQPRPEGLQFAPELTRLLFYPCVALTAFAAWRVRGEFFTDYGLFYELQHQRRGMLLAVGVLVLVMVLVHASRAGGMSSARTFLLNRWVALYAFITLASLALGGRMYFVSGAVTLVAFWTVFNRPVRPARIAIGLLAGAAVVGLIGAWRIGLGGNGISGTAALFNIALEPVLVGHSLFTFLALDRVELLNAPILLGSQLLNLVPTAILPNKLDYILDPARMGYGAASPFGAFSSFASWIINFGAIGTPLVLFLLSFGLEHVRLRATPLAACCYAVICGFIPFSLFRDPFYTSVVKSILQLAVIIPVAIVTYMHVLSTIATARPRTFATTSPAGPVSS